MVEKFLAKAVCSSKENRKIQVTVKHLQSGEREYNNLVIVVNPPSQERTTELAYLKAFLIEIAMNMKPKDLLSLITTGKEDIKFLYRTSFEIEDTLKDINDISSMQSGHIHFMSTMMRIITSKNYVPYDHYGEETLENNVLYKKKVLYVTFRNSLTNVEKIQFIKGLDLDQIIHLTLRGELKESEMLELSKIGVGTESINVNTIDLLKIETNRIANLMGVHAGTFGKNYRLHVNYCNTKISFPPMSVGKCGSETKIELLVEDEVPKMLDLNISYLDPKNVVVFKKMILKVNNTPYSDAFERFIKLHNEQLDVKLYNHVPTRCVTNQVAMDVLRDYIPIDTNESEKRNLYLFKLQKVKNFIASQLLRIREQKGMKSPRFTVNNKLNRDTAKLLSDEWKNQCDFDAYSRLLVKISRKIKKN